MLTTPPRRHTASKNFTKTPTLGTSTDGVSDIHVLLLLQPAAKHRTASTGCQGSEKASGSTGGQASTEAAASSMGDAQAGYGLDPAGEPEYVRAC
jgi:hypothetical protein